jgi:hypothetical protein
LGSLKNGSDPTGSKIHNRFPLDRCSKAGSYLMSSLLEKKTGKGQGKKDMGGLRVETGKGDGEVRLALWG